MRVHDPETHYELAKLRILHDKTVNRIYRQRGMSVATAMDPEVVYNLDALDALIETDADEEAS